MHSLALALQRDAANESKLVVIEVSFPLNA